MPVPPESLEKLEPRVQKQITEFFDYYSQLLEGVKSENAEFSYPLIKVGEKQWTVEELPLYYCTYLADQITHLFPEGSPYSITDLQEKLEPLISKDPRWALVLGFLDRIKTLLMVLADPHFTLVSFQQERGPVIIKAITPMQLKRLEQIKISRS